MSQPEYRTSKLLLEKANFATFRSTSKGTIASLTDSRLFTIFDEPANEPANERPTSVQRASNERLTTNLEGIEGKEGKEEKKSRAVARPFGEVSLPEILNTKEFTAVWSQWIEHLLEKKCKTTPTAFQKQIEACAAMGVERAVVAINHSIGSNWQGIFEPRAGGASVQKRTDGNVGTLNDGQANQYRGFGRVGR
jgi:hypothetical protein